MKRKLLSLLVLIMTAISGAWADVVASGTCGDPNVNSGTDVSWTLTDAGVLTISGTGAMADYTTFDGTPWNSKKGDIKSIVIGSGVTSIGDYAFVNCGTNAAALTVNFAEGTAPMTIGYYAFKNANLTSITIPNRVTSIDDNAFNECRNLTSVSIPASVTSIGETAFLRCGTNATALTVTFAEGSTLTTIGPGAFAGSKLTSITIPHRVTSIGDCAFYICSNLATITLNSNPTIGVDAFENIKDGATVTMNLTANSGDGAYWMTFYNENYSFTADGNTTIYKAKVNDGNTAVVLTEVGDIPANNAAVLKSSNEVITMTLASSTSGDYTGNELKGAESPKVVAAGDNIYCLSNETTGKARGVGFYTYTGTIPVNRAYLVVTGGPSTSRGFLGFGDDDEATAIHNSPLDPKGRLLPKGTQEFTIDNSAGTIYDLSGRIVKGQPRKGIYVKNGKLVVIK